MLGLVEAVREKFTKDDARKLGRSGPSRGALRVKPRPYKGRATCADWR
jgi:hypothetical protein